MPAPMKFSTPLARKALLVGVTISQWTARKNDRRAGRQVIRSNRASEDAGNFNKLLIAKERLAEVEGLVNKSRDALYRYTQPWVDNGPRILPNALYARFCDEYRGLKREFTEAVDRFVENYPAYIQERRRTLGGLFDEEVYPAPDKIGSRFRMDLVVLPFPDAADFRSELDHDTIEEIQAQLQTTTSRVVDHAMQNVAREIAERVGHMAERLAGYQPATRETNASGVFRDSLILKVRELAELLPAFNLTED